MNHLYVLYIIYFDFYYPRITCRWNGSRNLAHYPLTLKRRAIIYFSHVSLQRAASTVRLYIRPETAEQTGTARESKTIMHSWMARILQETALL